MICDDCAWEADEVEGGWATPKAIRKFIREFKTKVGHAACKGCTCAHLPVLKDRRAVRDVDADA